MSEGVLFSDVANAVLGRFFIAVLCVSVFIIDFTAVPWLMALFLCDCCVLPLWLFSLFLGKVRRGVWGLGGRG